MFVISEERSDESLLSYACHSESALAVRACPVLPKPWAQPKGKSKGICCCESRRVPHPFRVLCERVGTFLRS